MSPFSAACLLVLVTGTSLGRSQFHSGSHEYGQHGSIYGQPPRNYPYDKSGCEMCTRGLVAEVKAIKEKLSYMETCDCEDINSEIQAVRTELAAVKRDLQSLGLELGQIRINSSVDAAIWSNLTDIRRQLFKLQAAVATNSRSVSFSARLFNTPSLMQARNTLVLEPYTNVGGAYHGQTGIFTAPYNGTYLFYFIFGIADTSPLKSDMVARIYVDEEEAIPCAASYTSNFNTAVCQTVVRVRAGQKVKVQNIKDNSLFRQYYTSFGGHLIQAEN